MKWISVKERLPEKWVSVLGYIKFADPYPAVRECWLTDDKRFFFPALRSIEEVTHWMPMPDAPQETKEGEADV